MTEQAYTNEHGWLRFFSCAHGGCGSVIALSLGAEEQARRSHETFYCPAGHAQSFRGATDAERKLQAQVDQERRLREEAERRAADEERERLRVQRELGEARRTLRRGLKVAGHVIQEEKKARGARRSRT